MAQRKAKKVSKKAAPKKAATTHLIPLKKICQTAKMDPKLARRKLRAAGVKGHSSKARWEFTAAQAKKAQEVLST